MDNCLSVYHPSRPPAPGSTHEAPLLTFRDLARQFRRPDDSALHVSTLHRWRISGIRGVRLRAVRVGGRWMATRANLDDFIRELTARHAPEVAPLDKARTPAAVRRDLDAAGL